MYVLGAGLFRIFMQMMQELSQAWQQEIFVHISG